MSEVPALLKDLALILVIAGVVTLLFKKLKQPLVLGYIIAGFLVSPHMPWAVSVVDKADIKIWADIGVIFLLFSLGLDFSFKKIIRMGMAPVIAVVTIIFSIMALGILVGYAFGWNRMDCIFLGGMLAMSSTTTIYKAFNDMGLRQQQFAGLVMSVLILEDILAIVMMVMLSTIAVGNNPDGGKMIESILKIGFFLILWFVVGIFLIPLFLRSTRRLMTNETLLIVALGLCCLMAVLSSAVGFSSAFGAFVMGSILAETIEADKIIRLVEPVKNLFGAIFFVSVGMLVDPKIIVDYAVPIVALTITILVGQGLFGTAGFMLSGRPLKSAMQCSFSMMQVGEFAFIIASLGLSLGVIGNFLYPVVVAVSVITTFLTPFTIRAAAPCYTFIEHHAPKQWRRRINHTDFEHQASDAEIGTWHILLRKMTLNTVIYSILSIAVIAIMFTFFLPFVRRLLPHWWANGVCGVLTIAIISPFLRAIVMKNNHSEEFKQLWAGSLLNRFPLIFTIIVRWVIGASFLFYICNYLTRFTNALILTLALVLITTMMISRGLKLQSMRLERLFVQNLHSREIAAEVHGKKRPRFEGNLLDRDIHISDFELPEYSKWVGKKLKDLQLRNRFGIHVSSILRGQKRINIPNGDTMIFPLDIIQAIGNDEQLRAFGQALKGEAIEPDFNVEQREMILRQMILSAKSPFIGKTLKESGIRNEYNCMVVGVEEGQKNLTMINPTLRFTQGDILWIVGEKSSLNRLMSTN